MYRGFMGTCIIHPLPIVAINPQDNRHPRSASMLCPFTYTAGYKRRKSLQNTNVLEVLGKSGSK